ncbi:inositol monophosphatase family protein [Paractinoplanes rishiriensis]|uniref:Phosphatase n=1 Tax=Paractinoplanes rishiriensis TaxID=1050105 RepID=A0A919K2G1_9ACTN|nr:inositol monophosphatase family protein [Actinoplanes rishiriensis]GIE98234.1 phosphatase [Actinoplanes rishiriensis]
MSITDGELAIAAAEAGAVVVRERFGESLARVDKGDGDFATAADIEAEAAILAVLGAARPDDYVIGEESGRSGTGASGRTWLVDPLCGTLNFAARTSLVSVNVALKDGSAAAIADPFAGEVFWTAGAGAFVRRAGTDEKLTPEVGSRLVDVNLDPPFPNDPQFRAVALLADREFVATYRPRVVSTALAVAWTAAGRRAAYLSDGHQTYTVHSAAGIALCRAAGCVVTNLQGHELHSGVGGILVAADPDTHADLLRLIGKQFGPR